MNGIQRVTAAIKRLPLDRIPKGELVIEKKFIEDLMRMTGRLGSHSSYAIDENIEIEFYHCLKLDLVCVHRGEPKTKHKKYFKRPHYIQRLRAEGFFIFSVLDGAFQSVMWRQGFLDFLKKIAAQPAKAGKEMKTLSQELIPSIKQAVETGTDGIIIADDIAYDRGTFVSPAFIDTYLLPCWQEQTNAAKALDVPVFFHSDGRINDILPTLLEAGFDGLQCIEPAAGMDIKKVKKRYGRNLSLMGNIDPALLSRGKVPGTTVKSKDSCALPHQNRFPRLDQAVSELISVAGPDGGFIFGTCSGLYSGMSPEKVLFMYKLADRMGAQQVRS